MTERINKETFPIQIYVHSSRMISAPWAGVNELTEMKYSIFSKSIFSALDYSTLFPPLFWFVLFVFVFSLLFVSTLYCTKKIEINKVQGKISRRIPDVGVSPPTTNPGLQPPKG